MRRLHAREHRSRLTAVQNPHQYALDHIVKVMTQRDFVAAELARLFVQQPAPHFRAQKARIFLPLNVRKNVRFEELQIHVKPLCIALYLLLVLIGKAGVHRQIFYRYRQLSVLFVLAKQRRQQQRVLAARHANADFVAAFQQFILVNRLPEFPEKRRRKLPRQAVINHIFTHNLI